MKYPCYLDFSLEIILKLEKTQSVQIQGKTSAKHLKQRDNFVFIRDISPKRAVVLKPLVILFINKSDRGQE
jgi:hypothetical protein